MKIVIDKAVPFIEGVLEPYAEVVYKDGEDICRSDIINADAMIIRTRTKCDGKLLRGTSVKMIATATIGTDHIDLDYCNRHHIFIKNAAGCNSGGVVNYVFSALYGVASRKSISLTDATIGIIGVGNVGHKVEMAARSLGFKVLLNDPPRAEIEGGSQFCGLDYLLANSDIVTLHVPSNKRTHNLADEKFFAKMKVGAFFINAARGEIVKEKALLNAIPKLGPVVIDTWKNEPDINRVLMDKVDIATPHIAGYSYQGKQLGTSMAVRGIARFFGITDLYDFFPEATDKGLEAVKLELRDKTQGEIASTIQYNYPIFTDDFMFRMKPDKFEELRKEYNYRREFYID